MPAQEVLPAAFGDAPWKRRKACTSGRGKCSSSVSTRWTKLTPSASGNVETLGGLSAVQLVVDRADELDVLRRRLGLDRVSNHDALHRLPPLIVCRVNRQRGLAKARPRDMEPRTRPGAPRVAPAARRAAARGPGAG